VALICETAFERDLGKGKRRCGEPALGALNLPIEKPIIGGDTNGVAECPRNS
jgi:hypothetical protein